MNNVISHSLNLPCCGSASDERKSHPTNTTAPSVGNTDILEIKVYPNPANSSLYFEFPASDKATIKLLDISGRIIDQQVVYDNTTAVFDVSNYTPGIYLYQVITGSKTQSGKILIGK